jgi:hypothetical protein
VALALGAQRRRFFEEKLQRKRQLERDTAIAALIESAQRWKKQTDASVHD